MNTTLSKKWKAVAWLMAPLQLLTLCPIQIAIIALINARSVSSLAGEPNKTEAAPVRVKVNRTVPRSASVARPSRNQFPEDPSEQDFRTCRVFSEPLLPIAIKGKPSRAENSALGSAILAFERKPTAENCGPLEAFLTAYPDSIWKISLETNLGIIYRRAGYWTEALRTWKDAWELGQKESDKNKALVVDQALAGYAELAARLGRVEELKELVADFGTRDIRGPAAAKFQGAKESLNLMETEPNKSFRCGPFAVGRIYLANHPGNPLPEEVFNSTCTGHGTNMMMVRDFAGKLGMKLQLAKRSPGAPIIIPAVINWKVGHFAAIVKPVENGYWIQDPTFSMDIMATEQVIDREASGYFLVPEGNLPKGWRSVSDEEGASVWGKGAVPPNTPPPPPDDRLSLEPPCKKGMASYDVDPSRVNLKISDIPLSYSPPVGGAIEFSVSYSAREQAPAASPLYPNLGPQWSFNWLNFIIDDPNNINTTSYGPGGGTLAYTGYASSGSHAGSFASQSSNHTILKRTSETSYELDYPDGSKYIYGLADSSTPKRIYLTEVYDAAGNETVYTYDVSSFRLLSLTDAIGQVSTLTYVSDIDADPGYYLVEKVTDPFGRYAQFSYNVDGQLSQITDTVGITSQFTYGTGNFVTVLTTPYGDTTFVNGDNGNDRSLEITDPSGGKEKILFKYNMTPPDSGSPVPTATGLKTDTGYQINRTTYYWDKKAYLEGSENYQNAHLMHWTHTPDGTAMDDSLESEKRALEHRVYYNYPGQASSIYSGTLKQPTKIARVLDDGTTQLSQVAYNSIGKVVKLIDPLNRVTTFTYAANDIDLLAVYQENPSGLSTDSEGQPADLLALYTYNSQHLPLTSTDASGQTTIYTYNTRGQIETMTNAKGELVEYTYGSSIDPDGVGDGFLKSITRYLTDAGGGPDTPSVTSFRYDGYGRLWKVIDPEGYTVTIGYDAIGGDAAKSLNRPAKVTYPDGTTEETTYDRLDAEWVKDRLDRWTRYYHDSLRHLVAVQDPTYRLIQYQWCRCGALDAIIDQNGSKTRFARDVQGRVSDKIYKDGNLIHYQYEGTTSRLKSLTDAKGQVSIYVYNKDNTLKSASYGDGITPEVSYTYDAVYKRPAAMVDVSGTTTYTYSGVDGATLGSGMLASIAGPLATIAYSYDELGRTVGRSIDGIANTQTVGFDSLGRPNGITNTLGIFSYNYVNTTGRLDHVDYPNSQKVQYDYYDNAGDRRLKEIKNLDPAGNMISQFNYGYDAVGKIISWTQNYQGLTDAQVYSLDYDGVNRLICGIKKNANTSSVIKSFYFRYDAAGNRVTEQADELVVSREYNNLNQLITQSAGGWMAFTGSVSKPSVVTVGGSRADVDASGSWKGSAKVVSGTNSIPVSATDASDHTTTGTINVTVSGGSASAPEYDLNGNTISDGTNHYEWDSLNRLVKIWYGAVSVSASTEITYDGISRRTKIEEKDSSGTATNTKQFVWDGLELCEERDISNAVTRRFYPQGEQIGGTAYFYGCDHLGSIRELTDSTGAIKARYDYDLWGNRSENQFIGSGAVESEFGFTGYYLHAPSMLYLAPYRIYDARIGRWLSRDPIEEQGGLNLYEYVAGDPISETDSSGLLDDSTVLINQAKRSIAAQPNFAQKAQNIQIAVQNGLTLLGGNRYGKDWNIVQYDGNMARVIDPNGINMSQWTPEPSSHGSGWESPIIPGTNVAIKFYDDPQRGTVIAPVAPTDSAEHVFDFIGFILGADVNQPHADELLNIIFECP